MRTFIYIHVICIILHYFFYRIFFEHSELIPGMFFVDCWLIKFEQTVVLPNKSISALNKWMNVLPIVACSLVLLSPIILMIYFLLFMLKKISHFPYVWATRRQNEFHRICLRLVFKHHVSSGSLAVKTECFVLIKTAFKR